MAGKVNGAEDALAEEAAAQGEQPAPKKSKKKLGIIGGIVGVIVVAAVGMFIWHNDPSFCANPVCHVSMDPYLATYSAEPGAPTTDKWGNEVTNANAMIAVSHKVEGKACLDCHVPDLKQQVGEAIETVTGNYVVPLEEVDVLNLMLNSSHPSASGVGDEFCLNEGCHNFTRDDLKEKTSTLSFNPHAWEHPGIATECSDCHKSHRASTLVCTQCHEEAYEIMPDGWVDFATGQEINDAIYA